MKLVILGPPGSGKGTVAEQLEKQFGWTHVSPGAILREEVAKKTTIGKEIAKYVERGELVPAKFVSELVKLEIAHKEDYILDGFPRSLDQAKYVKNLPLDAVLFLDVHEDEIRGRLAKRGRKDDHPEIITERFKVYEKETVPILGFYKKLLIKVHGVGTRRAVYQRVLAALGDVE